jgi:hypothetical protein
VILEVAGSIPVARPTRRDRAVLERQIGSSPDPAPRTSDRSAALMPFESVSLTSSSFAALSLALYVVGGFRFRRWAVEGRPGVPRFSPQVETILLWLLYSSAIAVAVVVLRQTARAF